MELGTWRRRVRAAALAAARVAVLTFPRDFRATHGDEMLADYAARVDRRLGAGVVPAGVLAVRACIDFVAQGIRERWLGGRVPRGHGRRPAQDPSASPTAGLGRDVRIALRRLRRTPGFTLSAVCVLALGIGANATVFSALELVVLAPPPYPEAERLVIADLTVQRGVERGPDPLLWSYPKFRAFLEMDGRLIDTAAGYANRGATLTEVGPAEMINLEVVSPGYFELLGRSPVRGRAFVPDEIEGGEASNVTVLSYELWRGRFGGSDDLLGSSIVLNGRRLRVVGIAPEGFDGLTGGARLWIPMGAAADVFSPFMLRGAAAHWFHVLGRLAPGATAADAIDQMEALGTAISEIYPPGNNSRVYSGSARPLAEVRSNEAARTAVVFLSLAAGLVLLVACANLSGLLIARARRSARDSAVRMAVGASRWRIARASLVESLSIAAVGGLAGVILATLGTRSMAAAWPRQFLNGQDGTIRILNPDAFAVDSGVLAFSVFVTLATAVLFGAVPALWTSRADVAAGMRDGAGATRAARRFMGIDIRAGLVGAQVCLALVLIIGAGLVGESTLRLLDVDEGFRTERLVTFTYMIPTSNSRIEDPRSLHDEFLAAVRRMDGVESATIGCAPLRGRCIVTRVDAVRGGPEVPLGEGLEIGARMVDDVHFSALGIPLIRGRAFDERDGTDRVPSIIINEFAADRLFPNEDPIGRFIELGVSGAGRDRMGEVVGVVGDVLYGRPDDGIMAEAYYSYRDIPEAFANVTVRARGEPLALVPQLRSLLADVDPTLAMYRVETMDRIVSTSVGDRRTTLWLLGLFAGVAALLAVTGTWSVVAYSIADRRKELGLRLALGAEAGRVVRIVLHQGVRSAILGIVAGLVAGSFTSRLLEAMLWETEPTDPAVYAGGAAALFTLVMVASWIPARRAARVDPVEALRAE